MNEWLQIESAPKDVHILVFSNELKWQGLGGICIGYAHSDYNGHKNIISLDGRCGRPSTLPTHWQPLPSPPT